MNDTIVWSEGWDKVRFMGTDNHKILTLDEGWLIVVGYKVVGASPDLAKTCLGELPPEGALVIESV